MFKKIKAIISEIFRLKKPDAELQQMKVYYKNLQCGALFLKYIYLDIQKNKKKMNRAQYRRFNSKLKEKGQFSEEIIRHYMVKCNDINTYIEEEIKKINDKKVKK